ncbi:DUF4280 domain-containing protein [uncultured Shewanella sp.]|uniref:DUF4280 domain-containing protein n=1 Tax=uncultured Shewanella sp. TaxID=173975 RepID=UPI00262343D3|nr:DUF4280 domain-containing protein [uncultured Shewanella sp.]
MPKCVSMGALMKCPFGTIPAALIVPPINRVFETTPGANILDHKPMMNIPTFGPCKSLAFPATAAATAAALGALTPMPCIPGTMAPWVPGDPTVLLAGAPILTKDSKLMCMWGGVIEIQQPGQIKVEAIL